MFAEGKEYRTLSERYLEQFSRQYPRAFTVALAAMMVVVSVLLLLKTAQPVVLYQGF
jgi:hypothetical protein